jgi:alanine dehydrogenase
LAEKGYQKALTENPALMLGLNVYKGRVTYQAVADALNIDWTPPEKVLQ